MAQFPFKSYCWSVGTTSFRTVNFNMKIEQQLILLNDFWALPENANSNWTGNNLLQEKYYRFMQEHNFVTGNAPNPAKDARQKTSGLVEIGLIDNDRKLTAAGQNLLNVSQNTNFGKDNVLQIPNDSYIYLKQLLKMHIGVDNDNVRPFVVTVYSLLKLGNISDNEFTYLLPLCTNPAITNDVITAIEKLRNGIGSIDEIILSRLMSMENYKAALEYFLSKHVIEKVITAVGMNRKSGESGKKAYDKPYYKFYQLLYSVVIKRSGKSVLPLYEQCKKLNGKPATLWKKYIFNTTSKKVLKNDGLSTLNKVPLLSTTSEQDFKRIFFKQMHLFKTRATLSDYADLNRRYFKTTDTVIFKNNKAELDVLPRCWLYSAMDKLLNIAFTPADNLVKDVEMNDIASFLVIDKRRIYANLKSLYSIDVDTDTDISQVINNKRYQRFNSLIDEKFDKATLIDLLKKFENRDDDAIRQAVTNNADIPTLFEYVIGIVWYLISGRKGDVLSYMNLSLEADLLPRTHAQGGNADIEYVYEQTDVYPSHTLLIEVTLSDSKNQRKMEMEPVSRHLGEHILSTGDHNAYCVFVSTSLYHNVISDFRNRRTYQYYSDQYKDCVDGLKILPLTTTELCKILEKNINYGELYLLFETAYHSDEPVPTWYKQEVINIIGSRY